ncbi:MAG: HTH domain-containing protein [Planctomycetes bacterium]|nr:HTH domain-containing protein [Planctomycetota bacterium]
MQSRRNVTVGYLAQSLGCSRRTVFRDIKLLREAGFAVWYDEALGTYVLNNRAATKPEELSESEWKAVLLAAGLSPIAQLDFYGRDLTRALAKLMALVPQPVREETNNLLYALESVFDHSKADSKPPPYLAHVLEAISRQCCMRVVFQEDSSRPYDTKLSPFKIYFDRQGWGVCGRSSWHRSVIDLPIDQICHGEILDEIYSTPHYYLQTHLHGKPVGRPHLNGPSRHAVRNPQALVQSPTKITVPLPARGQRSPQR